MEATRKLMKPIQKEALLWDISHRRASFCIGFINFLVASIMFYVTQQFTIFQSFLILVCMFFIAFTVLFLMNKNQTAIRLKVKIKKSMVKLLSL